MAIADLNITNQADSLLVGTINNVDDPVTFSVTPGDGDLKFPTTAGGKYFRILAIKPDNTYEIMMVTSRTSDSMTADRELEGTSKLSFSAGAVISHRLTAQDFLDYISALADAMPKAGGTFTGTVTFDIGADVASATALAVDIPGNVFDITGTVTVTSMNTKGVGTIVVVQFDGACILTHHATDLVLPGKVNITTAAGDMAIFVEYDVGKWRCVCYTEANLPVGFFATQAADQAVPDFTDTKVNFTNPVYDYGGNLSASVFTATTPGDYDFSTFVGTSTGFLVGEDFALKFMKNGLAGTILCGDAFLAPQSQRVGVALNLVGVRLAAGDTVQVMVTHTHGASATIDGNGSVNSMPIFFSGRKTRRI